MFFRLFVVVLKCHRWCLVYAQFADMADNLVSAVPSSAGLERHFSTMRMSYRKRASKRPESCFCMNNWISDVICEDWEKTCFLKKKQKKNCSNHEKNTILPNPELGGFNNYNNNDAFQVRSWSMVNCGRNTPLSLTLLSSCDTRGWLVLVAVNWKTWLLSFENFASQAVLLLHCHLSWIPHP